MTRILSYAVLASVLTAQPALSAAAETQSVCLSAHEIDNTEVARDGKSILFYMADHRVWKNTLQDQCVTLGPDHGFIYTVTDDEICSNLESIRVIGTGEVCELGEFTPVPLKAR